MATKQYLKLGLKAAEGSFYDPITKVSLAPGQVIEAPSNKLVKKSSVFKNALAQGHITAATEEEFDQYIESQGKKKKKKALKIEAPVVEEEPEEDEDEEEPEEDEDEDDDEDMTKDELIKAITESGDVPAEKKKGLSKLKKEDLQEIYDEYVND